MTHLFLARDNTQPQPAEDLVTPDHSLEATCELFTEAGALSQMLVYYERSRRTIWMMMRPTPRPSFNRDLLNEIIRVDQALQDTKLDIEFGVLGSLSKGMFNAGGDLAFFVECIRTGDREALRRYAHLCVDAVYTGYTGHRRNMVTLALVEGAALGGGLESALANHFVLAQKGVKLGFPEIAFNLFPGMGAYSFGARRAGQAATERLILSGEALDANWHLEHGLVDQVFEPGEGIRTARTFIDSLRPKLNGVRAMLRARHRVAPVHYEELVDITDDWVEAAFSIQDKDLAYMERLVTAQTKRAR
jgi:DSF synthase